MRAQMGHKFASYLIKLLSSDDHSHEREEIVKAAVATLGRLVKADTGMSADVIENAISSPLRWLGRDRRTQSVGGPRHFAAVFMLRQLAMDSPTHFYVHVGGFFEVMWSVLCDLQPEVRTTAASILKACLEMAALRKVEQCHEWYSNVYTGALDRLESHQNSDAVHGALLAIQQLLCVPHSRDEFVSNHLFELVNGRHGRPGGVFSVKGHKDRSVRQQFLHLLPALHKSRGLEEVTQFDGTVRYLIELLRKGDERADAFRALGEIARTREEVVSYVGQIFVFVRESLLAKRSSKHQVCVDEALECVRMFVEAYGTHTELADHIRELLPIIFDAGLSLQLAQLLQMIMVSMSSRPEICREVQERLLDAISKALTGQDIHAALDSHRLSTPVLHIRRDVSLAVQPPAVANPGNENRRHLSFDLLSSFDFGELLRTDFLERSVVRFLNVDSARIRRAAALCCCQALTRVHTRGDVVSSNLRNRILERCVVLGTTDMDVSVRSAILTTLASTHDFDDFLAVGKNLRLILVPLHDEALAVRKIAMNLLGRLGRLNPSYAMPTFRKILVQLLTQLEYSNEQTKKEEAVELLTSLIRSSHELVQPYATPIAQSLIGKLEEKLVRARVAARMLEALVNPAKHDRLFLVLTLFTCCAG